MINPAPYNAEAPPAALAATSPPPSSTTCAATSRCPTHDGTLEIGGAVGNPTTLTLDDLRALPAHDQAVTLECAGNGRLDMRPLPTGEPWGDYAVSTARWTGALLHEVLAQVAPAAQGVEVRVEGPTTAPTTSRRSSRRPTRTTSPSSARSPRRGSRPASAILIAYVMNGEPLDARPRRPVPADRAPLVRRRLREVAEADRRPDRALHRRVPDRPLHLPVAGPPPRGRAPHAGTRPHHRPGTRRHPPPRPLHGPRKGLVRHRPHHPGRRQPHRRRRLAARAAGPADRSVPVAGLVVRLGQRRRRPAHPARQSDRRRRQRPTRRPPVEPLGYGNNAIEVIFVDRH